MIKTIRVGRDPWRIYMSHDGKYGITANNGDETISIIDTQHEQRGGHARGRPGHDRRQLRRRQGVRHQLDQRLRLRLRHGEPEAGRPHQDRHEHPARDGDDGRRRIEKIYLAESTNHEVVIIDARTHAIERVRNVGLFPWGTHIMDSKDNYCH